MENKKIERFVEVRSINQEKRQVEFVISNESVDRHGTVFMMDGWELDNYRSNPVVLYNHNSHSDNPDMIIGTSEIFEESVGDKRQLVARATFEEEGDNPIADKVWKKINKGTLKMASVGAIPHEGRWGDEKAGEDRDTLYFTRQELVEWSVVTIGSNRDALKRNTETIEELKRELGEKPEIKVEVVENKMDAATENRIRNWERLKRVNNIDI